MAGDGPPYRELLVFQAKAMPVLLLILALPGRETEIDEGRKKPTLDEAIELCRRAKEHFEPDVHTGPCETGIAKQTPSAKNQSLMLLRQLNDLIAEIDSVLNGTTHASANEWLRYVRDRIEKIVKAVAVDTNEERTTASKALHGRETN